MQRREHPVGHLHRVVGGGDALEDDHELVTTEARQPVPGPDGTAQTFGDHPQQLVADLVAEVVVHHLETVDVAEKDRDPGSLRSRLQECMVEMVEQQPAVGQPRQRILERMTGQLLLERLALRSVTEHDDRTGGCRRRRRRARPSSSRGIASRRTRSNRVSSLVTLRRNAMARVAGSSRKPASPRVTTGARRRRPRRTSRAWLAPAGFMKVIAPLSLMAKTPSPRLLVITESSSFCRSTSV